MLKKNVLGLQSLCLKKPCRFHLLLSKHLLLDPWATSLEDWPQPAEKTMGKGLRLQKKEGPSWAWPSHCPCQDTRHVSEPILDPPVQSSYQMNLITWPQLRCISQLSPESQDHEVQKTVVLNHKIWAWSVNSNTKSEHPY